MNVPRILQHDGHQFHLCGRGTAQDTFAYLDHSTGKQAEFYIVEVMQTGSLFSLGQVIGPSLPAVKVDHRVLAFVGGVRVGDRLLAGPLNWAATGPTAQHAWRLNNTPPNNAWSNTRPTTPSRRLGIITHVHTTGAYGHIRGPQGADVFVHISDCRPGLLRLGQRVSFAVTTTPRGQKAVDVTAA
ncbi:MAG: cold-shock protein [Planctomycetaceae bacterium]